MSEKKKRLMLPNDERWIMKDGFPVFGNCKLTFNTKLYFNSKWHSDEWRAAQLNDIRSAAAVGACWWYQEYLEMINADMRYAAALALEKFKLWHELTTAESLDGYEFVPWE